MTHPSRRRPPVPVVAALVLYVVKYVVAPIAQELWSTDLPLVPKRSVSSGVAWLVADVVVTGILLTIAYGLWRGYPASRVLVVLLVVASLDDPCRWGRPVTIIEPMFGYADQPGEGPRDMWYRLTGAPGRDDTARRFASALRLVAAVGHTVLVLDDVREICRQLRLAERVDSVMNLSRSAAVSVILAATETGYVSGRSQAAITWVGATSGLDAARAGAATLGRSGRTWYETTTAVPPHAWIYHDTQPGSAGPCLTRTDTP